MFYWTHPTAQHPEWHGEDRDDHEEGECSECHARPGHACKANCECDACLHQMVLDLEARDADRVR